MMMDASVTFQSNEDPDIEYELLSLGRSDSTNSVFRIRCEQCHQKETNNSNRCRLIYASVICLIFMVAEIIGGILSNSLALATDASHLLVDFGSFMISLLSLWLASRPATEEMNFGWYRAEILGALLSVLTIWFVTGILVYEAVLRIISRNFEVNPNIMLPVAIVGIIANAVIGIVLHYGSSSGSGQRNNVGMNLNIRSAIIHVVGDFIQSIGVFIAALVIYFKPEYKISDPICTFVFSLLVVVTTITIIKDVLVVLMEGTPKGMHFYDVQNILLLIPGVLKIHNLRLWSLNLDRIALSAHIIIVKGENPIEILKKASEVIISKIHVHEITLQIEEYDESLGCSSVTYH